MNVCILARKDLTFNTRILRQAVALEQAGHEVLVLCAKRPGPEGLKLVSRTRFIEVPLALERIKDRVRPLVDRLRGSSARGGTSAGETGGADGGTCGGFKPALRKTAIYVLRSSLDLEFSWRAVGILEREKAAPDIVMAHDSVCLDAALRAGKRRCRPVVYDAVEIPSLEGIWTCVGLPEVIRRNSERRVRKAVKACDGVMTVSNSIADYIRDEFGVPRPLLLCNCRLYEPAVDDPTIRRDCGLVDGQRLVLYLNSRYPGQGLEELVDSLAHLPADVHLAALGPTVMAGYDTGIMRRAEGLGVGARLHFLTPKPSAEMLAYASGADVGVVPRQDTCLNNRFSLPNRIFELIMARLPLAVSSLPDMSGFVREHGIGRVFDQSRPEDIAATLAAMLEPGTMAELKTAVGQAAESFCWENEGEKFVNYLEQLHQQRLSGIADKE